jgi:hypothetical protein
VVAIQLSGSYDHRLPVARANVREENHSIHSMKEVVAEPLQQPLRNLLGLWFVAVSTEEWRLVIIIGDPSNVP